MMSGLTDGYRQAIVGWVQFLKGHLGKAIRGLGAAQRRLDDSYGRYSTPACVVAGFLAEALYEANQFQALEVILGGRLEVMNERVFFESYIRFLLASSRLQYLNGNEDNSHQLLERLSAFGQSTGLMRPIASAQAERVRLLILSSDLPGAKRAMSQLERLWVDDGINVCTQKLGSLFDIPALVILSRARCALAEGNPLQALHTLDRLNALTSGQRLDYFVKVRLLRSIALQQLGRAEWREVLMSLVGLTAECAMVRSLCDEGPEVYRLLHTLVGQTGTPSIELHLSQLLQGFGVALELRSPEQ